MLDHTAFREPAAAIGAFWDELKDLAESQGLDTKGTLEAEDKRTIVFLDTLLGHSLP